MKLTRWQWLRSRAYLFLVGLKRRMILGTRVAVIDGDKVLLVRLGYLPGWHFPGGGVEPGETAAASAAREVLEETGYRLTGPMPLHGLYLNVNTTTNRDHIALFTCRGFVLERSFTPNHEIVEIGWFGPGELPDSVTPPTRRRLDELFGGGAPDEMW